MTDLNHMSNLREFGCTFKTFCTGFFPCSEKKGFQANDGKARVSEKIRIS